MMKKLLPTIFLLFLSACVSQRQLKCDDDDLAYQKAARSNNVNAMESLENSETAEVDQNGFCAAHATALIQAAHNGSRNAVNRLLKNGASIDIQTPQERVTALMAAAKEGHRAIVELLLEEGASIDFETREGITTLMMAAQKGHEAIVRLLLERKALVNARTKTGDSALLLAAKGGYTSVVALLLEHNANPNVKNEDDETPLGWAKHHNDEAMEGVLAAHTPRIIKTPSVISRPRAVSAPVEEDFFTSVFKFVSRNADNILTTAAFAYSCHNLYQNGTIGRLLEKRDPD